MRRSFPPTAPCTLPALFCATLVAAMLAPQIAQAQTVGADQAQLQQVMRAGAEAMHAGHAGQAENFFRQATTIAPSLAEAHLDLGLALVREGKLEDADKSLRTAQQLNPDLPGLNMFLGITDYEMNRYDDARAALQRETEKNPTNAEPFMWLGVVNLAAGKPEQATAPLDRAAELAPKDLNILDYRGRAHSLVSRDSYSEMYRLNPDSWHVHRALGQTYSEAGKPKEAVTEYLAAIRQEPKNSDLYESIGNEYQKLSQFDLAEKAYEQELNLSPRNAVAMYNLGKIRVERDDAKDGVPLLEDVAKFYSGSAPLFFYLGLGLSKLDRNQQAAEYLQKAVATEHTGDIAQRSYYELSRVYRKLQRPQESQRALAEFVKLKDQANKQSAEQVDQFRKANGAPEIGSAEPASADAPTQPPK